MWKMFLFVNPNDRFRFMAKVKDHLWHEPTLPIETDEDLHMNANKDLSTSKFIKKEECDPAILVTIQRVVEENVAKENEIPDLKWVIYFAELNKPLVLNQTNGLLISRICGSAESDDWTGTKVVLYNDPTIMFGGEIKGGIRVRVPQVQAQAPAQPPVQEPAQAPVQPQEYVAPTDDIPF